MGRIGRRRLWAALWAAGPLPLLLAAAPLPFRDAARSADARSADLVARLTPEEKASQLTNQARAIPRLGIPAYNWWSEALHGVARNGPATVFPEPIGLAATFDAPAIRAMGDAIGTEARVKWNRIERQGGEHRIFQGLDFWSPNVNIFRDPRWGRGQETYGEDPFLTGRMGSAFVEGLQGPDPDHPRVIATAKHFAVHSGPEPTRHGADVAASAHDMEDTYLPAFHALVTGAHVQSVMCAYNRVNGQPACASDFLLDEVLRERWRFTGYVVSDCDAIADIQHGHHYTATVAEAAAVSLKHGVDNDCTEYNAPAGSRDFQPYADAMRQGLVDPATVDAALRRLFAARIRLGLFDPAADQPLSRIPDGELNSPAHRALALRLADESMVLLKNDGVLPVRPGVKRIAVVGPLADQVDVLLGNYNGEPIRPVTALDGIRAAFPGATITFAPGTAFLRKGTGAGDPLTDAVAAARGADLVVAVVGITSALEGEEMKVDVPGFAGGDRTSLDLPAAEQHLLEAVKATGKPLAVVLMNGSALSVNWAAANADAILDAWYPGEAGGNAIGRTLAGLNNPAGRLPVTFYTGPDQLPPFDDYSMANRTYRYFGGKPLFPFGHGLSYTRFGYSAPRLTAATLPAGQPLGVEATVRNEGRVAGDEVVQLYLSYPPLPGAPGRALAGFTRVHLDPGERRTVRFELDPRALSSVTPDGRRQVRAGDYGIAVGGGQPGPGVAGVAARLRITGTAPVAD